MDNNFNQVLLVFNVKFKAPFMLAFAALLLLSVSAGVHATGAHSSAATGVLVINFDIGVDQGASSYVSSAASIAISNSYDIAIVMNTPGGELEDMLSIVNSIANVESHGLSVYTFVPYEGLAASAGSYIALSTDGIYMANGSFIGPSTPYVVGGTQSEQQHVQNAMIAYMRSLASIHGYNVTAAVNMAANNTAYPASTAIAIGLVTGSAQTFHQFIQKAGLSGLPLHYYSEPMYDQFLSFLSNSTVDGIFLIAGFVAIAIDFLHRTILLTVAGVVLVALGLLGAEAIGAPAVALFIIVVAAILIFLEVKAGHGIFVTAGVLLGLFGTFLLAGNSAGYSPSPYGIYNYMEMGLIGGVLVVCFLYLAKLREAMMNKPKLIDPTRVVGMNGRAVTDIAPGKAGVCNVNSEDWTCFSDTYIQRGSEISVAEYSEGRLKVKPRPVLKQDERGT